MSKPNSSGNSRLGMRLFFLYTLFYLGFVLVNAFAAKWAEWQPIAGLNLAILWGFSLIGLAFLFAMIYGLFGSIDAEPESDESPAMESTQQASAGKSE